MLNISFLAEDRRPISPIVQKISVVLCGIVPLLIGLRTGASLDTLSVILTIVASVFVFVGWSMRETTAAETSGLKAWVVLLSLGAAIGAASIVLRAPNGALEFLWIIVLPLLIAARSALSDESRVLRHIVVPLTFGSIFMFTSGALGIPAIGAFPAVIGALFVAVLRATLDIEEDMFKNHANVPHIEVEKLYRHRLAITAVVFFLFGTVSLWPWLGDIYGKSYFWLLLFGVLLPLAFFWGRIRQPKLEGARTALIRFNRIAPVLGLIHIAAFIAS